MEHVQVVRMEARKILWAVAGVGLLAVVVLSGALYLLRPRQQETVAAFARSASAPPPPGFDAFEFVRGGQPIPGILPAQPADEVVIVIGGPETPATAAGLDQQLTGARRTVPSTTRPATQPPAATTAVAADPSRTRAAARPILLPYEYWIQVGSFSSQSRAAALNEELGSKGLVGRISTRDTEGNLMYRVRVGPYVSHEEADKFLAWVKDVPDLSGSYVSRVSR